MSEVKCSKEFLDGLRKHAELWRYPNLGHYEIRCLAKRIDAIFGYMLESAQFDGLVDCYHSAIYDLEELKERTNPSKKSAE